MDGLSAVSLNMRFVHVSTSAHLYLTEKFLQSLYEGGGGVYFQCTNPTKIP